MNNFNNNNDEVDIQIRKFLKQVGVGSHQIIENELKTNSSSSSNICIKLEIDNKEIKKFETTIKKIKIIRNLIRGMFLNKLKGLS